MRVLFVDLGRFQEGITSLYARWLGLQLQASGHQVQGLTIDSGTTNPVEFPVKHLLCAESFGGFPPPVLQGLRSGQFTFAQMTDAQIADFRDALREEVNSLVDDFNPDVVHCSQLWLDGTAVLETGVPYLIEVCGADLQLYRADPRFGEYVDQAAENAGRLLVPSSQAAADLLTTFDVEVRRVVELPHVWTQGLAVQEFSPREQWLSQAQFDPEGKLVVAFAESESSFIRLLPLAEAWQTVFLLPEAATEEVDAERLRSPNSQLLFLEDWHQLWQWMHSADCVALPSSALYQDHLIEVALSLGTPVVADDIAWTWHQPEWGSVVPADHPENWHGVISELLDAEKTPRFTEQGCCSLEQYRDWILERYQRILADRFLLP